MIKENDSTLFGFFLACFHQLISCQSKEKEYFLVILVDAKQLRYDNCRDFLRSMAKHPADGTKDGSVGHAWIYLRGVLHGQCVELEGGHSGELGYRKVPYLTGITNNINYGYANPTTQQRLCPAYEPNPVRYLWESLGDGFWQEGTGDHKATYAAKIDITESQFHSILQFIDAYNFSDYAITRNQCSTFVARLAQLAGWELEHLVMMRIDPWVRIGNEILPLWRDPSYATITFSSPDRLQLSLMESVRSGKAECVLHWYRKRKAFVWREALSSLGTDIYLFPKRLRRLVEIR